MSRGLHILTGAIMLLTLAACSGGDEVASLELSLVKATRAVIAARTAPETARPPLTRAALDTLDGAFLEVTLERRDQLAYLYVSARRRDGGGNGNPGQITVWRTEDDITLALRGGVLIATRGLGGDILSSSVQLAGDRPGPARGGEKILTIRALDNKAVRLVLTCDLADLGPATIEIVERRHATRHLRETCQGGIAGDGTGGAGTGRPGTGRPGQVVNDYWVDAGTGLIWQSRQWAGPEIGYLRLRQLTN